LRPTAAEPVGQPAACSWITGDVFVRSCSRRKGNNLLVSGNRVTSQHDEDGESEEAAASLEEPADGAVAVDGGSAVPRWIKPRLPRRREVANRPVNRTPSGRSPHRHRRCTRHRKRALRHEQANRESRPPDGEHVTFRSLRSSGYVGRQHATRAWPAAPWRNWRRTRDATGRPNPCAEFDASDAAWTAGVASRTGTIPVLHRRGAMAGRSGFGTVCGESLRLSFSSYGH
jgi:hypothetical protein